MGIFDREEAPVPVTILGGFLGAGKTTLLNHLVRTSGLRLGVLVNDFGEIDIDGRLVAESADGVVSLANGCVCCTIRGDVGRALFRLLERKDRPEHVILETSGISNPGAVVEALAEVSRTGAVRLDGVVSVVDALHFLDLDRSRGSLAWCQIVAADLLVVSKVDVAEKDSVEALEAALRDLAPEARILSARRGEVSPEIVLRGHPRDELLPHVHDEHCGHAPLPHGFVTSSFTTERPFSWRTLAPVLKSLPAGVFRVKGLVCLEERPDDRLALHVVGRRLDIRTIGPREPGSVRSDIVFIGQAGAFDPAEITRRLAECCRS